MPQQQQQQQSSRSSGPSISPLAMERHHNGFANGVRTSTDSTSCKIESYLVESKGYSEVDRGMPAHFGDQLSPIRASSPNKRASPVGARIAAYNQQNKSYSSISSSSPKSLHVNGNWLICLKHIFLLLFLL